MNLFILDKDTKTCAQMHCDKHVIKMLLETAQIMSSALSARGVAAPYKPTHARHPSTLWCGNSSGNYMWCANLFMDLTDEYTYRFDKTHATSKLFLSGEWMHLLTKEYARLIFRDDALYAPALAINPISSGIDISSYDHTWEDAIRLYRMYYATKNREWITKYTRRDVPDWLLNLL